MVWNLAEVVSLDNNKIQFKIIDKNKKNISGEISMEDIKWTLRPKKLLAEVHKIGDVFFIKKEKNNWKIKQYPKVNGGIVVIEPYNGNVLALVGGLILKK